MATANKHILVVYHSQGGTMERLARRFVQGAAQEPEITVSLKRAGDATVDDLLHCDAIAIGSPEYFGTMERLARRFAQGAAQEPEIAVSLKRAGDATVDDLLHCNAIAIGSPEYFGTMAGMIKDFFDRTYAKAQEKTIGLPFVCFVCAGNDGRGAITQMERIIAGYKWRQALEHLRIVGPPTGEDYARVEELGHTLAAGLDLGIF